MLQDNKCVLNCLYFYIRTYTDVFYMYCILFCFNVYVYISVPIYVFILIMNPGFNRSILFIKLDCFLCFVRNDEINRLYIYIYIYLLLLISMLWHRQAIFESKGDKLSSSAEGRIRTQRVSDTYSPADWMPAGKPTELSRIKLKTWTRQPIPMISKHSAHLTPLPFGIRTWLWRYTYLLLLISMLWHRQAIFESKGDKLSSSAEGRIRTQRVSDTYSPADWMPAGKPTELSRIKLKTWTRQPIPMISKHSAHLTPLPFGIRTWLWRYTYLLLLISMLWHRQAIFESKGDKLSSSAEGRIRTQRVSDTYSPADWMPAGKPTELSRIKLKTWTRQPIPMISKHSAHLTPLPFGIRTWLWRYTYLLLLISMLWHRQAIFESKGDKLSSSAEGRIRTQRVSDTYSPADWMPAGKPTELSRIKLKTWTRQPIPMISKRSAHLTPLPFGIRTWLWRYTYLLLLISMLWHRQAIFESKGDKLSSSAEGRIRTQRVSDTYSPADWMPAGKPTELSRIKLKTWTRQPIPMISKHSAHLTPLPFGIRTWLWRYTYLLLLISMLWHRQAIFESKGDKLSSSAEGRIRTQRVSDTYSPADWMPAGKPTELSRIKLKTWTRQPIPMISKHSAHLTPLPFGIRTWLWRYTYLLLLISMLWHRQAIFESKGDKLSSSAEGRIRTQRVSDTYSPADWMPAGKPTELSRIKLKTWTRQPIPMISKHSAHLTPLPFGIRTWLWRYTYLLLLISMLWHRQAIFESKGDKLSSSAEGRIRTQRVSDTYSPADWMPAGKPTELSRIKLKTWTRQPIPMISKHSAHLTPLPFGIRTWLWRYTYLLLLISMLWHRQAIFESKGDKLSSSAEGRIRTQRVSDTYSPADWMPAGKPTELSRIKLKTWTRQPIPMISKHSAHLTPLPFGIRTWLWRYTYLLLLISMLWHRQAIFESKGDKLSSSAEGRIRTQRVSDTYSPADWMPAGKPTELSRIKLKTWTRQPIPMISKHSAHLTPLPFGIRTWLWRYTYLLLLISMLWHRQAIFESKGDKLSSSAEGRIRTQRVSDTYSPADWMPAGKPTELSRIKLKTWTRQPIPMISKHSAHLTPLPFGIRTWLWRYTYLLLLISMLWHRQAIFESHIIKLHINKGTTLNFPGI